jgi:hypothetical protein
MCHAEVVGMYDEKLCITRVAESFRDRLLTASFCTAKQRQKQQQEKGSSHGGRE